MLQPAMNDTRLLRGDGDPLILDSEAAPTAAPSTPVDAGPYAKTHGHRFLRYVIKNLAGAGTATVKVYYSNEASPTLATDWVQDVDVGTGGSISLGTASLEARIELAGYPWVAFQVAAIAGGATVTVTANAYTEWALGQV